MNNGLRMLVLTLGASGLLAAGACEGPSNRTTEIATGVELSAFQSGVEQFSATQYEEPDLDAEPAPLLRREWTGGAFVVPNVLVEHQPPYATPFQLTIDTPRQRGEYPGPLGALEHGDALPSDRNHRRQTIAAFIAPLAAVGDLIMFLPRAFKEHPFEVIEGGSLASYERRGAELAPGVFLSPDVEGKPLKDPQGRDGIGIPPEEPLKGLRSSGGSARADTIDESLASSGGGE